MLAPWAQPHLERAIGVVYRLDTERTSHYFEAVLPEQFDAFVWFAETSAVTPLPAPETQPGESETYPTGLWRCARSWRAIPGHPGAPAPAPNYRWQARVPLRQSAGAGR